ncbi:hypothetical protein GBA65_15150 [Rubrobacter marinus]|uniref:Uncharacterized protein n=1 Tax=Rubrobacter marinus TaxID=2653852 RepID=A0A6G8PZJ9_9ACTN|nr:hypothetical protein [Rubrobacter marinus]QIN79641.1 hypothetical protein GBA65_15150 [Rubrobacter marinus]
MGIFGKDKETQYGSDIVLGERYRDEQTGIEGTAISVHFYQHACERVALELVVDRKIEEYVFDAPRLTHIESGKKAETEKTGGPDRGERGVRPGIPPR